MNQRVTVRCTDFTPDHEDYTEQELIEFTISQEMLQRAQRAVQYLEELQASKMSFFNSCDFRMFVEQDHLPPDEAQGASVAFAHQGVPYVEIVPTGYQTDGCELQVYADGTVLAFVHIAEEARDSICCALPNLRDLQDLLTSSQSPQVG